MKKLFVLLLSALAFTACKKDLRQDISPASINETGGAQNGPVPLPAYKWTKFTLTYPNTYPYSWADAPNLVLKTNETDVYLMMGSLLDHLLKFDNSTKKWLPHSTTNQGYMGFDVFSVGYQHLFSYNSQLYEGLMQGGPVFNETFFGSMNPVTGVTTDRATFPGITTGDPQSFVIGNKGYLISGFNASTPRKIWEYDFAANQWTNKGNYPLGNRQKAVVFVYNNKAYMGLGYVTQVINGISVKAYIKDWIEYDPATNTSVAKLNFPGNGRGYAKGFVVDNSIYMGLGKGISGNMSDFWKYSPSSNTWSQQAAWPGVSASAEDNIATFSLGSTGYLVKAALSEFWQFSKSAIIPAGVN